MMNLTDADIQQFIQTLRNASDYDFSEYSEKSFRRRIEKILGDRGQTIQKLQADCLASAKVLEDVVRDITVNTTELFRDPATWLDLYQYADTVLRKKERIAVWSAGCSNGLEMYSTIIMFNELGLLNRCHFVGSDLNDLMLERADIGHYTYRKRDDFFNGFDAVWTKPRPELDVAKYFDIRMRDFQVRIRPELRGHVNWLRHNLTSISNPVEHNFDLIMCRNVLIYFNHELQERLFYNFYKQLNHRGALVLGVHEGMLGPVSELFNKQGQLYIKP